MKVDMQNFKPLTLFQQFSKGSTHIKNSNSSPDNLSLDKNQLANNLINNKLNAALNISAKDASHDDLFDFEKIGENILGFVSKTLNNAKQRGASESELQALLSQAKQGIKEGLTDATKELKVSGLYNDDIKQGITDTKAFLADGLKELTEDLFNDKKSATSGVMTYREATHYNLSKDASLSITTKEGDQVNITFNSDYLQQTASTIKRTENNLDVSSSEYSQFKGAFSLEVNGELNEDEQEAINELMANLQNVSDLFFEGDLEEAFEEAKSVAMDPTHLAAFSMDLQRTETVASVKEYQSMMPEKAFSDKFSPINSELKEAYEEAKPFAIEEHLNDLLAWLIPDDKKMDNLLDYSQAIFEQLKAINNPTENEQIST